MVNRHILLRTDSGWPAGLVRGLDLLINALTALVAGQLYLLPTEVWHANYLQLILIGVLLQFVVFGRFQLYDPSRRLTIFRELRNVVAAWLVTMAGVSIFIFFTKSGHEYSRLWWGLWFACGLFFLLVAHIVLRLLLRYLRRRGVGLRRIVLVGYPNLMAALMKRIDATPGLGFQVEQFFDPNEVELAEVARYVQLEGIDQVWVTLPLKEEALLHEVLDNLALTPVEVKYVPDLFGLRLFSHSLTEVNGLPVLNLCSSPMHGMNALLKAIEDRVLSVIFLLILSPLMLLVALAVKLSSRGPVFFTQDRLGIGGRTIRVLKFRSMVVHEESDGAVTQATRQDPRITTVGAFLRRTSLDELPQFINVLRGEMSIVGPRPHAMAHNAYYQNLVEGYMDRHRVKPGITGWAQVNGYRGETETLEKMQGRVEYDLYYIENWSLWFDLKIIVLTALKGFVNKNAY